MKLLLFLFALSLTGSIQFVIDDPCIPDVLVDFRISENGKPWAELLDARMEIPESLSLPEYCMKPIEFCFKTANGKGCFTLKHDADGKPSIVIDEPVPLFGSLNKLKIIDS